jgi:hypothetical protein
MSNLVSNLIIRPRRTRGSTDFWYGVESTAAFTAHYHLNPDVDIPATIQDEAGTFRLISIELSKDMALVIEMASGLQLTICQQTESKITIDFSHASRFCVEEMLLGRPVIWQAMPFNEKSAFALDLVMQPGESGVVKGSGFELDVRVE